MTIDTTLVVLLRWQYKTDERFPGEENMAKNITIYSTTTWPWCTRVKEYLSQKGFAYTDYDVGKNRDKAREMIQKSGQMGVPVVVIESEIIVGFNQAKIDAALAKP